MNILCSFAILILMPGLAAAQTTEYPLIQLQPIPPAAAAPLVTVPGAEAEQQPSVDEPPKIYLPPPVPDVNTSTKEVNARAEPIDRDTGAPAAEVVEGWLLSLVPTQELPTEVRIGGSMPAPGQFRLSGEVASADFVLTLPDYMSAPKELLLSLRSSVNVLADTSHLTVTINGTELEKIALDNIGAFSDIRLPTSALTPGVNHITLNAAQSHRIFCGPEASFAIWTEVELGKSGVMIDPALLQMDTQGFLAAIQSQIARDGAVEILVDDTTDMTVIRDVARRITDAVGGAPKITVLPFYSMEAEHDARARIALITSVTPKASFRRGARGALVLQIEHAAGATPDLSMLLPQRPAGLGISALTPGDVTTMAELGTPNILANTRYFRQDLNFLLPEDWLLLASQKASLKVHYGFSADLPEGALLLIKVNDQTVRLLPLDREGGRVQPPLAISFPANHLNPGINTLTFEMTVPGDPPDLPCTPRSSDMLVILDGTTLNVPPSPKMRQTDMSRSLGQLDGSDVTIPAEVANPAQDTNTLLAFGALLRPLVKDGTRARLHIVGLSGVGLVPTGSSAATRRMLQNAVYPTQEPPAGPKSAAPSAPATPAFSLTNANGEIVAPAAETTPALRSYWQDVSRFFSPEGWLFREAGGMRDLSLPGTVTLVNWLEDKSGVAMLLQLDPETPDDIWLIAGPDISMNDLAKQVDSFRRGGRGEAHGQAALLMQDGHWVTWSEKRRPELLETLTPWNLRTVLGNYASWSPSIFTLITLLLALISVIPALFFVLLTRRSGSRT